MSHVDPEVLALAALGEPATSPAEQEHLAGCERCREEIASLARVVSTARSTTPADSLVAPPPAVWDAVRTELGLPAGLVPGGPLAAGEQGTGPDNPESSGGSGARPHVAGGRGGRRRERPMGRSRTPWIAAAAAAGLVVGGAAGSLLAGRDVPDQRTLVAQTELDPLPGWDDAVGAAVVEEVDGSRELVVTLEGADDLEGYREVWLIDLDVSRMVSLGVLEGSSGRFTLPAGLDLGEFPIVDVSDEPFDGDPAHSGQSILRGVLEA